MSNDFPSLGINPIELLSAAESLLVAAREDVASLGAINWGALDIGDIEYRLSMLYPNDGPRCVVVIEEASPDCGLDVWLSERLDSERFPNTYFQCEW